jgi:predicted Ser/Thr protein kinase
MSATCPRCGAALPAGSPEQLCPRCLLQAGLDSGVPTPPRPESPATAIYSTGFAAPTPEELQKLFPALEIVELLGKGGMGAVYKARQITLDRFVAVKILPPHISQDAAFAERFAREARSLAKLNHPNIVSVYDFGQTSGLYYFVMEYVDGVNVRQAMRAGTLSAAEALKVVPQVCDALQFAHDEGIVHRDIKPENILLDKKGRVKIADFGLAKLLGQDIADAKLTGTQQVMGTLHYMAPEQVEGTKGVDHRADIYSLGVTFYEMLTGELPLGRFAPPSQKVQIDVRLDEVVLRTLENEPDKRYQHVSQVKTEVETIGGLSPAAMQMLTQFMGREYRSKTTIFGIPLLHIASGIDPKTGKRRIAKGIIAFGDVAIGGFACGGVAMGGITFGGLCLGMISFGGLAVGLVLAIAGMAIGSIAFGGLAIGAVTIGGVSVGWYSFGGFAIGRHVLAGGHRDPEAMAFFGRWVFNWQRWLWLVYVATPILCGLAAGFIWVVFFLSHEKTTESALARYLRWAGLPTIALWLIGVVPSILSTSLLSDPPRANPSEFQLSYFRFIGLGVLAPLYFHYLWLIFGQGAKNDAATRARHAGNWLFGIGIAIFASALIAVAVSGVQFATGAENRAFFLGFGLLAWIVGSGSAIVCIRGGWRLAQGQESVATRIAAIVAILPLSPIWPLSLPIGILILRTLGRDDVRSFLTRRDSAASAGPGLIVRVVQSRAFWMGVWSLACATGFWFAGASSYPSLGESSRWPHGLIDAWYWPYRGSADISVSLTGNGEFGRIVISERRELSSSGWQQAATLVSSGNHPQLTRDEFRLHIPGKDAQHDLVVNALDGLSWSFTDAAGARHAERIPFDKGAIDQWLDAIGRKDVGKERNKDIASAIAEIVLSATTNSGLRVSQLSGERDPVGQLERILLGQKMLWMPRITYPFADHVGTERIVIAPIFNILWASIPAALAVWLGGLWVLRQRRNDSGSLA